MKKIIVGILVVILVVVGGLTVVYVKRNDIVKKAVESIGPEITKTQVKLASVELMPFSGSGKLHGLMLGNPEGYKTPWAVKVGEISVAIKLSAIGLKTVELEKVSIAHPEITFEGGLNDNNLKTIQRNAEAATHKDSKDHGQTKIKIKHLHITGAKAHIGIPGMGGRTITVSLPEMHLRNIGTGGSGVTKAELVKQILGEMTGHVDVVAGKAVSDLGTMSKEAVHSVRKQIDKAAESIKGLFGK